MTLFTPRRYDLQNKRRPNTECATENSNIWMWKYKYWVPSVTSAQRLHQAGVFQVHLLSCVFLCYNTSWTTMFEDSAFLVAVSMSYICLFFVLTFFKYEVIFRTGVILVAAFGFFFPILYGLPYIIILWRILVGLNVATDQKLYIARCIEQIDMDKADFSGSTTLNHWAVVIRDSGGYVYTHAVGNVVSRMRNTVLFIAVALSTAFAVSGHPYARVLNPLFLTNLFAAWELSRIGIHNQAQEVDLRYISSVFRAYFIYPRRGDFFLLLFICGCFAYLYQQLDNREFIVISSLLFVVVLVLLRRTRWCNFQKIDIVRHRRGWEWETYSNDSSFNGKKTVSFSF